MANTGDVICGVGATQDRAGGAEGPWANPTRITANDGSASECVDTGGSDYLVARSFGFSVTGTINGVLLKVDCWEEGSGTVSFNAQLQNDSAALIGSSKATTISTDTPAIYTWGAINDLWGATLTPAIVNSTNFGVRLWFTTSDWILVDYVSIQIEYTPAAAGGTTKMYQYRTRRIA